MYGLSTPMTNKHLILDWCMYSVIESESTYSRTNRSVSDRPISPNVSCTERERERERERTYSIRSMLPGRGGEQVRYYTTLRNINARV